MDVLRALGDELRLVAVALQFFTRVPIVLHRFEPRWLNDCARWFPLVGAVVGAVGAGTLWLTGQLWPAAVAIVLSMAATAAFTGAFHEDGLADTFDALGGVVPRERALEIMKDSRIGSYGALALVLVLAARATATGALCVHGLESAAMAVLFAHVVSRAMPVLLLYGLPYAGDPAHAKARPLAQRVGAASLVVALVTAVAAGALATTLLPAARIAAAGAASLAAAAACARWFRRRLGGFTGDTLGATQQLCEAAVLLALGARWAA